MDTQPTVSGSTRRSLLQRSALLGVSLSLGLPALTGSAAAEKPELVEAIALTSGLSKADSKKALEGGVRIMTEDLRTKGAVCIERFGCHVVNTGPAVGRYQDGTDLYVRKRPGRAAGDDGCPVCKCADRAADGTECPVCECPGSTVPSSIKENEVGFRCSPELAEALGLRIHPLSGIPEGVPVLSAERLADASRLPAEVCSAFLHAFVAVCTDALKKGDRIEKSSGEVSLPGFGTYSISKRSARTGRNPQTGKEIQIAAKNVVKFKAGAELSKAVN